MTATSVPGDQSAGLERNAIGLPEVLFQSITHMAPAVATALSIGFAANFAGRLSPLAVLLAMVACLFTAYSIGQLGKHLPSAGGMYTYVARGLGPFFGWLVAWAFAFAEPLIAPILLAAFGFFGAVFLATYLNFGADFQYMWIVLAIVCGLLLWWLIYSGVQLSTRAGVILGIVEMSIFVLISVLLIANAGSANTLSVFVPGDEGIQPAFQGMIFCLLAFIGFEAAAPLGEEARDPRRTIPRAVIWSTVVVGAFYVLNMYAATVFFGPDRMGEFYTFNDGDPWGFMATEVLGTLGGLLVVFAILNSSLANANSSATAATRSVFSMGRAGLLPRFFAALHPTRRTPVNAVHVQVAIAIVVAIGGGLILADDPNPGLGPINIYVFIGTMLGLVFAGMYIAVNAAVIGFYLRERRDEFNPIKHFVVPVIGIIAMIPALLSVIGGLTIPFVDVKLDPWEGALAWTAPIVAVWMLIGIVLYFVLRSSNPAALGRLGEIYGGEAPPVDDVA
ncbi:MAG TPA: APC family permease [Candidatus Limnocylindrales bacterium]|nr:APC family permease [Candidatus Limnocylindrales bacterium]